MSPARSATPSIEGSAPTIGTTKGPIYFGYGSNMWLNQMHQRCPHSPYLGIAILENYKWIINQRGYANVVPFQGESVYGLVFQLDDSDQDTLDRCEGAPFIYEKRFHDINFLGKLASSGGNEIQQTANALVYIDSKRIFESDPKEEYIDRTNMAIRDALKEGVPRWYIDKYLRKSIPDRPEGHPKDIFLGTAVNKESN